MNGENTLTHELCITFFALNPTKSVMRCCFFPPLVSEEIFFSVRKENCFLDLVNPKIRILTDQNLIFLPEAGKISHV